MIVATAGHVDHGKTTLIKALTGMDTTHLPEERRRGMTIDLGFAGLALPNGHFIGFVDVPGHERFIHNMLAGITGVDLALLIVAADDGIKPQTREHLEILDLLNIQEAAVAITKIDRVDGSRLAEVSASIPPLLSSTSLAGAPVFAVSAPDNLGIPALREHLISRAAQVSRPRHGALFRLPIDRSFVREGAGLVVTGTIASGQRRGGRSPQIDAGGHGDPRTGVAYASQRRRKSRGRRSLRAPSGRKRSGSLSGGARELDRCASTRSGNPATRCTPKIRRRRPAEGWRPHRVLPWGGRRAGPPGITLAGRRSAVCANYTQRARPCTRERCLYIARCRWTQNSGRGNRAGSFSADARAAATGTNQDTDRARRARCQTTPWRSCCR